MNKILLLLTVSFLFASCSTTPSRNAQETITEEQTKEMAALEFWTQLKSLQGKTFEGQLVNAPANDDFSGKRLVMHVLYADDEKILIPFNVGDNLSRTWIFTYKNGRIELKHDHRHEDGSSDEVTMYGGTSTNEGTPNMQVFPADQETVDIISYAFPNVWWITVDSTSYTYNLRRMGTDRHFSVSFDLTTEIEKPEASWGWEDWKP